MTVKVGPGVLVGAGSVAVKVGASLTVDAAPEEQAASSTTSNKTISVYFFILSPMFLAFYSRNWMLASVQSIIYNLRFKVKP